jgi:hypothetical protein
VQAKLANAIGGAQPDSSIAHNNADAKQLKQQKEIFYNNGKSQVIKEENQADHHQERKQPLLRQDYP